MDVALLGATAVVALREKSSVLRVTLFLSISTLSLGFLEICPESSLMFLAEKTLPLAYKCVLWLLSFLLLVVIPGIAGAELVAKLRVFGEHWTVRCLSRVFRGFFLAGSMCFRKRKRRLMPMTSHDLSTGDLKNRKLSFKYCSASLIGGLAGVSTAVLMGKALGPMVIRTSDHISTLALSLSWLCAFGVSLSAILNGFGSVSLPYSCLQGLYLVPVSDAAIAQAVKELNQALESLRVREEDLLSLRHGSIAPGSGWMKPPQSGAGEDQVQRKRRLESEVDFIGTLAKELEKDISEMKESQILAAASRTTAGTIKSMIGVIFSLILLVRLFAAVAFLYTHSFEEHKVGSDPVTVLLASLSGQNLVSQDDFDSLAQVVSLALTAMLGLSQTRTLFRIVSVVTGYFRGVGAWCCNKKDATADKNRESLNDFYTFGLALVIGCYSLACIVMTKSMLPIAYRTGLNEALGGDGAFSVRSYAINCVFCVSALLSVAVLGIFLGIKRQNTRRFSPVEHF